MKKHLKQVHFLFIVFLLISFVATTISCNQGATPFQEKHSSPSTSKAQPPQMPVKNQKGIAPDEPIHRKIVEPEFLKNQWSGVNLKVTNKKTGESFTEQVLLKTVHPIKQTGLTVQVLHFFPSFLMTNEHITSVSNEPKNPAAKVIILENDKKLMDHWMFSRMPQVHGFSHDLWQIELVDGIAVK